MVLQKYEVEDSNSLYTKYGKIEVQDTSHEVRESNSRYTKYGKIEVQDTSHEVGDFTVR